MIVTWNCANSVIYFPEPHRWDFKEKGWKPYDDEYSKIDYKGEMDEET